MSDRKQYYKIFISILLILFCFNISACSVGGHATAKKAADNKQNNSAKSSTDNKTDIIKNNTDENNKDNKNSSNNNQENNNADNKSSQSIVIVIDPGHGNKANPDKEPIAPGSSEMKIKDGGGATGVATGTPEYVVNRRVALKLEALLKAKGFTVIMTKTKDSENPGNVDRAEVGNKNNASLVIRIHADSCDNHNVSGATMLVPGAVNSNTKSIYSESKRCGELIMSTLTKEVGMNNRGISERTDLTGFNWSTVPVVLVEMGFLSNPSEDKLLCDDKYEDKIAAALSDGIAQAVGSK